MKTDVKKKKQRIKYSLILLGILFALTVSACRPSPALEQIIYTQTATVVDVDHKKLEQDKRHEDSEEDDRFNDENEGDDSGNADADYTNPDGGSAAHTQQTLGTGEDGEGRGEEMRYSPEENMNGIPEEQPTQTPKPQETPAPTDAPERSEDQDVEEGDGNLQEDEEDDPEQETPDYSDPEDNQGDEEDPFAPDEGEGGGDPDMDPDTDEDPDPDTDQDFTLDPEPESDPDTDQDPIEPDDSIQKKDPVLKEIDYGGIEQTVPTNADTVTACGYAAQFVEMLGGVGRLAGCDSDFWNNALAYSILPDLDYVKNWWQADGSYGIGEAEFEELLEAFPDAVICIDGDYTFSESQISDLMERNIGYVLVPRPSSLENIINGGKIIATVLTDHANGEDAMGIANRYEDWAAGILADASAGDSWVYSTYISDWRNDIEYWFTQGNFTLLPWEPGGYGFGVATGYSAKASYPVTEYLNAAGVTNEAANTGNLVNTDEVLITPMFHSLAAQYSFTGSYTANTSDLASLPNSEDWGLVHQIAGSDDIRLGDNSFRYIIAAGNDIAEEIRNNWYWEWHGEFTDENSFYNYAYVPQHGEVFWSSICGEYEILVSPYGFDNWAKGSVDSPLMSCWAAWYIHGNGSEDILYDKIWSFYNEFYGVSISDNQIDQIIRGM